ncbi:Histidine phosphatase superfamily (branch 1) [Alteribacillus persepolensis]|uniref:Histidine phosphatase superfamily (Branch 1) n=1 Tax=Alteribacillus persepolensis TaxID=568899 RepID=A0A1G7YWJ2_9BACI|nr:Histidine phosphatase superfamily (branch 1) [Alteribacillus persepolensis]
MGNDQFMLDFTDCSTQRNLSETGREQAIRYGEALRRLNIPIFIPVIASPFCRARETAALAFGEGNVRVDSFWADVYRLSLNITEAEKDSTLQRLQHLFEMEVPSGKNAVVAAHSFPPHIGLGELADMETVIIHPFGSNNGFRIIGRIQLEDWERNI